MGRIKKYSSFADYTRQALVNLGIHEENQPSNKVIERYHLYYLPELIKLQLFLQVRSKWEIMFCSVL